MLGCTNHAFRAKLVNDLMQLIIHEQCQPCTTATSKGINFLMALFSSRWWHKDQAHHGATQNIAIWKALHGIALHCIAALVLGTLSF